MMAAPFSVLAGLVMGEADASARASSASDEQLIHGFLATGDDQFFEVLVERFRNNVFRLAVSILGPGFETEAEDITQEVFVLAYRNLDTFRGDCAFSTWLYHLTRNRAFDCRRSAAFRARRVDAEVLERIPDGKTRSSPQQLASARERRDRLLAHVNRLGEPRRSVVLLHYWLDRSTAEIADLLNLRQGTVKSHLHRARRMLSLSLREDARHE